MISACCIRFALLFLGAASFMRKPFVTQQRSFIIGNPLYLAGYEEEDFNNLCRIKVVGVGGGGGNAVNRMIEITSDIASCVDFYVINTDTQALTKAKTSAGNALNIGKTTSRGLGAGGTPGVGRQAAEESRADIEKIVSGSDLVFITAGMGGGTGSGAAPIVAECAKARGALTVGIVTKPFAFEGRRRMMQAEEAIDELHAQVDTLIIVANDKLLEIVPPNTPLTEAFLLADDVLRQGVVGISELIVKPGLVNVDFADVRTVLKQSGSALMGLGTGMGRDRAAQAALSAVQSPLLDYPISSAKGVIFNVVGGPDMSLQEITIAADIIYDHVGKDANIIFGASVNENIPEGGPISVTVLATGFNVAFGKPRSELSTQQADFLDLQRKELARQRKLPPARSVFSSFNLKQE